MHCPQNLCVESDDRKDRPMKARHIAFRVDASIPIGTGHFMRCLTLADALRVQGAEVRFVCLHTLPYVQELLARRGHALVMLDCLPGDLGPSPLAHAHWLGTSQTEDAQATRNALSDRVWDWLVVDHYALDRLWESAMRQTAVKILAIDDIADRLHDCDALLDQNFYLDAAMRYAGKVPDGCQLMLGPRHALLRDEFRSMRTRVEARSGLVRRVLLFFGGVDAANWTGRAMDALRAVEPKDLQVDVVIGRDHPCRSWIESECTRRGFVCHVQTDTMAQLMADADLAIGAGGSATWERCCLGLPSLVLGVAENQSRMVEDLVQAGYVLGIASAMELVQEDLVALVRCALLGGPALRGLSVRGSELVDGAGVSRVVRHLLAPLFEFRAATLDDTPWLYSWRNHPAIRATAHDMAPMDPVAHAAWVGRTLRDPHRRLLIAQVDSVPAGVVRFDLRGSDALISVYLSPARLHKGLGIFLLREAANWLRGAGLPVGRIVAEVRALNMASLQSFRRAGYVDQTHILSLELEQP